MVDYKLKTMDWEEEDCRPLLKWLQEFMSRHVRPEYLGLKTLSIKMEVSEGGFDLICETNRQMNEGSRSRVFSLVEGFIAGWTAGTSDKHG